MSEAIEITSISRSHGRLTGPIFLRAVNQLHLLEFRSARSTEWPVNQGLLLKALSLCVAVLSIGAGTGYCPAQTPAQQGLPRWEFVPIASGEFPMDCSPGDRECGDDEKPMQRVRITRSFELGKYEITQAQLEAVMGANPSEFKGSDRPVEQVRRNDIQDFLRRLNGRNDGYCYRLPTEAEWEYAAPPGRSDHITETWTRLHCTGATPEIRRTLWEANSRTLRDCTT
jgi:formylglycine-generating enzyme required for sulfatase activity